MAGLATGWENYCSTAQCLKLGSDSALGAIERKDALVSKRI